MPAAYSRRLIRFEAGSGGLSRRRRRRRRSAVRSSNGRATRFARGSSSTTAGRGGTALKNSSRWTGSKAAAQSSASIIAAYTRAWDWCELQIEIHAAFPLVPELGLQRAAQPCVGDLEFLGFDTSLARGGHEVGVANPAWEHVQVNVSGDAGAGSATDVHA